MLPCRKPTPDDLRACAASCQRHGLDKSAAVLEACAAMWDSERTALVDQNIAMGEYFLKMEACVGEYIKASKAAYKRMIDAQKP